MSFAMKRLLSLNPLAFFELIVVAVFNAILRDQFLAEAIWIVNSELQARVYSAFAILVGAGIAGGLRYFLHWSPYFTSQGRYIFAFIACALLMANRRDGFTFDMYSVMIFTFIWPNSFYLPAKTPNKPQLSGD
jgi:hypothetical protein